MDLIKVLKTRIVENAFNFGASEEHWRLFIYHEKSAPLLDKLFTRSAILDCGFVDTQMLESTRKGFEGYPALYFVEMDAKTFAAIRKDIVKKMYKSYYVVAINPNSYTDQLAMDDHTVCKVVPIHLDVVEDRVFTFERSKIIDVVSNLSEILDCKFDVCNSDRTSEVAKSIKKLSFSGKNNYSLVTLDRSIDIPIALIHCFMFQAALIDLGIPFEEDKKLWPRIKCVHTLKVGQILKEEILNLKRCEEALNKKNLDLKTLTKMTLDIQENQGMKESIQRYQLILRKLFDAYEGPMCDLVDVEQTVSTGVAADGSKCPSGLDNATKIFFRNDISKDDKLRLFLLCSMKHKYKSSELRNLIDKGIFTSDETCLEEEMKEYKIPNSRRRSDDKEGMSTVDGRYMPVAYKILKRIIDGGCITDNAKDNSAQSTESLRRTRFVFGSGKNRKTIVLMFIDSVTWPEIQVAHEVSDKFHVNVLVGAPEIISPCDFVKSLLRKRRERLM